ncbi:hypothetical protein LMG29542_08074 [Paraburkholderia humisilvae]|uniref:Uncharacterized protein n=1 Tax=Paraburkholderia humisilvae TaxID=627669 RepID=A0A6J5FBQ6_9BURK|nr:hypothetical protein LMG29542_08074 [Paraburkholderia humisilvae]
MRGGQRNQWDGGRNAVSGDISVTERASAKANMAREVWAGVLPLALQPQPPVVDAAPSGSPGYMQQWHETACARTAA